MDHLSNDVFDNLPPTQRGPEAQSTWPMPLPDFDYRDFVCELEAAQTVSPADISIHPIDHFPATPNPLLSIPSATSQSKPSSSTKSSSHISTPSLAPQTPDGSCSTPDTSIDGAANECNNSLVNLRQEGSSRHRYKNILPAPSKYSGQGDDVALETQPLGWPQIPPHQAFSDEPSLRESFLASNYLPANKSTATQLNEHDPFPADLGWLGSHSTSYNHPGVIDASKVFDFDFDDNEVHSSEGVMSKYPPLTDIRTTAFDLTADRGDSISSHYGQGLYLPNLELEMGDDLFESGPSRRYTDMFSTDDTVGLYQSIEPRSAGTEYGEGSRRDTSRDDELLRLRSQGISYREIKQKYGFTEAESTLRGRYRTLTKSKDRRVRKPIWKDRDIHLLCDVVYHLAKQQGLCLDARRIGNWLILTSEHTLNKISWKKVTQEMENRGSYPYGFTTTKKKYFDVARGKI